MFDYNVDEELTLKLLTQHNATELFTVVDKNRDFLREWLPWIDSKKTVEDCQKSIERWGHKYIANTAINAGIFFKGQLVGMVAFPDIDWQGKKTSLGYWLSPEFEGKGTVIRCVNELIQYAFDRLDLNRIEISCAEDNVRSRALPEKLGFVKEGILRDHHYLNGDVHNLVVYSLLKSDRGKDKGS